MKTYLEIQVPLYYDHPWLAELRAACSHIPVRWQNGFFHITMAFIDDTPMTEDLLPILDSHLNKAKAPTLVFDKLDAFSTNSMMHIIHLTSTDIPEDFLLLVSAIRNDLKKAGCRMESDFRLHVTLGRVMNHYITLSKLCETLASFHSPKLSFCLTDVDYRVFRGTTLYETELNR